MKNLSSIPRIHRQKLHSTNKLQRYQRVRPTPTSTRLFHIQRSKGKHPVRILMRFLLIFALRGRIHLIRSPLFGRLIKPGSIDARESNRLSR